MHSGDKFPDQTVSTKLCGPFKAVRSLVVMGGSVPRGGQGAAAPSEISAPCGPKKFKIRPPLA